MYPQKGKPAEGKPVDGKPIGKQPAPFQATVSVSPLPVAISTHPQVPNKSNIDEQGTSSEWYW
ncbi:hypothetical protein IMZ48_49480 [Candidatus Bathyarchaeota archaeon]|nr:hypothetical protein [Candidatus Bathyarchaeota archaeon]